MGIPLVTLHTGRVVAKGCIPTPPEVIAAHRLRRKPGLALPMPPVSLINTTGITAWGMMGNSQYGDCVSAEEGHAKKVISRATGAPEVDIPDANVISWARSNRFLNGADLPTVIVAMQQSGMADAAGKLHNDGAHGSLDYTNQMEVKLALQEFKTIKIGVAASQLESVVGNSNGWFLIGARRDSAEDHCVGIYDYGTIAALAAAHGVTVPAGVDPTLFALGLCTWATIGIIDWQSYLNITSEAWVRITDPDRGDAAAWESQAQQAYQDLDLPPTPVDPPVDPNNPPAPDPNL